MSQESIKRLEPFETPKVKIDDKFWTPRLHTNREVTLGHIYEQLEKAGYVDNFRKAAGTKEGEFQGLLFNDEGVYKWVEAASYVLGKHDDPKLESQVSEIISIIADAQEEDGYLNTYFILREPDKKWTNLGMMSELYCAGHLIQAATAHYRATGKESLLKVARKLADHIDNVFGPDKKVGYPGHPEIELALVDLYRVTKEERYLKLAQFFVNQRGQENSPFKKELENPESIAGRETLKFFQSLYIESGEYTGRYAQDHRPVREQSEAVGHAVRAMYLYCGMADITLETGEQELIQALERIWQNMTRKRMYITGGIGSSSKGESFTSDYDLPNRDAYAETCAAIGSVMWNHRMLQLTGEARFADMMERVLYNGLLSGVSIDGTKFFYVNPLASDGDHHRQGWFECACCPPNIARLLASLENYIYLKNDNSIFVNLYISSTGETTLNGNTITVKQETEYPWNGTVKIDISVETPSKFTMNLRIPDWCRNATLEVNGSVMDVEKNVQNGYVKIDRTWNDGDHIELVLPMPVEQIKAHPTVRSDVGQIALQRGPLIYCLEEVDNPRPLHQISLPPDFSVDTAFEPELLGGVVTIKGEGQAPNFEDWDEKLYQRANETSTRQIEFKAIPYYAWDNREHGEMRVWIQSLAFELDARADELGARRGAR